MQIVYLSNRPEVLGETLDHVRHFMPWVDRALVAVPTAMLDRFRRCAEGADLVDESDLTGRSPGELGALDHVRRNVTIRRALVSSGSVAERFLLSDDDYRPLKPVEESYFSDTEGRDVGFACHDLDAWTGDETPFDHAQHTTAAALAYLGHHRRAFGSHMPQLMRTAWWKEAFAAWDRLRDDSLLDEWSLYFNVAAALHPDRMGAPRPFETMCWPPHPHEWLLWERPPEFVFENFYPDFYTPGHVFEGLPTRLDPDDAERVAVEKITRWTALGRQVGRLDFRTTPAEPWTKGNPLRRLTFRALWAARKVHEYMAAPEREAISQIQGTLQRLAAERDGDRHSRR
ncbi:MAG: hypothetical protein R2698_01800 [Microthrixaceae bacterium]